MSTETKYTVDYFIAKFEAISEEDIGSWKTENRCAAWHCGLRPGMDESQIRALPELEAMGALLMPEARKLHRMLPAQTCTPYGAVWRINDGHDHTDTRKPKQRILAALRQIKESHP